MKFDYLIVLLSLALSFNAKIQSMEEEKSFSKDEYALHVTQRKLADLIYALGIEINDSDDAIEDRRLQRVNPSQNRTKQGIFLELYYGFPYNIWSPFGKWNFLGETRLKAKSKKAVLKELSNHVVMELYRQEGSRWPDNHYGPIYAIKEIEGKPLPEAQEGAENLCLKEREALRKKWVAMTKEYYLEATS